MISHNPSFRYTTFGKADKDNSRIATLKEAIFLFLVFAFCFLWINFVNYIYGNVADRHLTFELNLNVTNQDATPHTSWETKHNESLYLPSKLDSVLEKLPRPITLTTTDSLHRDCGSLEKCVTAIISTHGRLDNVAKNIKSMRLNNYHNIKVIVVNDHLPVTEAAREGLQYILKDSNVQYKFYPAEQRLGIGLGRNIALSFVTTSTFLQLDDDFVFQPESKLEVMLDLLKSTNAVIVGGIRTGRPRFDGLIRSRSGMLRVVTNVNYSHLSRAFDIAGSVCRQVDLTINFFMARTAEIKKMGGWDEGQIYNEHEDFFIRAKSAGYGVVVCPQIKIDHVRTGYDKQLKDSYDMNSRKYLRRFLENYNIQTYIQCMGRVRHNELKCKLRSFRYDVYK